MSRSLLTILRKCSIEKFRSGLLDNSIQFTLSRYSLNFNFLKFYSTSCIWMVWFGPSVSPVKNCVGLPDITRYDQIEDFYICYWFCYYKVCYQFTSPSTSWNLKGRYNYEIIALTMVTFLLALKLSNLILNRLKFQIISNYFFHHIIFLVVLESIRKKIKYWLCRIFIIDLHFRSLCGSKTTTPLFCWFRAINVVGKR